VLLDRLGQLKNPYNLITNQTRNIPACSVVSRPITLLRAASLVHTKPNEPFDLMSGNSNDE
jgi:hypothetical protein